MILVNTLLKNAPFTHLTIHINNKVLSECAVRFVPIYGLTVGLPGWF